MTVQAHQLRVAAKNPCRLASTTTVDIATGGLISVDSVTTVAGDRVLLKDQSTPSQNGIYVAASGSWARALDMDDVTDDAIAAGLSVYIQEGTLNAEKTFILTTTGPITLGSTSLTFEVGSTVGVGGIGGSTGSTDNAIIRADGVGGSTVQASNILVDDSGNLSGGLSLGLVEQASAPVTPGAGNGAFWVKQIGGATPTNVPFFTDENALDVALVRSITLSRSMPNTSADSVELGSFANSNGQSFGLFVHTGTSTANIFVAYHRVVVQSPVITGGFVTLQPLYTGGPLSRTTFGDLIQVEMDVAVGGSISLRARSYVGIAQTVFFRLVLDGDDTGQFTPSSTQATTTATTTNYGNTMLTMTDALSASTGGQGIVAWKPFYLEERAAADSDIAGFGQLWVRNDTPNVLVFTNDAGTDTVFTQPVTETNAVYVSKAGNDSNNGLTLNKPKLTLNSAIIAANGLTPSVTNRVTIYIQDGGIYAGDASLPNYVSLVGPGATVEGTVTLGIESVVRLNRIVDTSDGIIVDSAGEHWVHVDEIDVTGSSSSSGIEATGAGSVVHLNVGKVQVSDGNGIYSSNSNNVTFLGFVGEIEITGSGWGIFSQANGRFDLHIGRLFDGGSATDGIDINGAGVTADLFIGEFNTQNTYEIASGSTLNLFAGSITGTTGTVAGTANVTEAGGIGGTTGATDEAVLLADGTGGSTVKTSGLTIANVRDYNPVKRPCRLATTADHGLSGLADVDGVTPSANDRILVWNQSTGSQNGIYLAAAGSWTRATDFSDATTDYIEAGIETYVAEGNTWGQSRFTLITTGALTIGSSSLTFTPEGGLARTDASSTEVIASTAFTSGTFVVSSTIDMRDHSAIAVYFDPTDLGSNTQVDIVIFWSDDGTTIPFATDDNIQQTDFNITGGTDGAFNPKPYTARLTTAGGELVVDQRTHLTFPKRGGACRIGVKGNNASGAFSVRTQRITY